MIDPDAEAFAASHEEQLEAFRIVLGLLAETMKARPSPTGILVTQVLAAMHDGLERLK